MSQNETEGIEQIIEKENIAPDLIVNGEIEKKENGSENMGECINAERTYDENFNNEETFNEIRQKLKNINQREKIQTRTDILYNLHRKIIKQREEIQSKGEVEKEERELSECTFNPKIKKINSNLKKQVENILNRNTANENYVEKRKKQRERHNLSENLCKNRVGTGNNWTKDLTIPKDFEFKTQGNIISTNNLNNSEMKDPSTDKDVKVNNST